MNLLRRPLRPRLRPLLLSEITLDGRSEPLSPLSSVSSSTSDSDPSSRPSSRTRSQRFLPPLTEETSHHVSLVTPFQSEQPTLVDHLTTLMNDDEQKDDGDIDDSDSQVEKKQISRLKQSKKILTPLKTREYSQFSELHHAIRTAKPRTLNRTPKFKGPPGLPPRQTRSFHDTKSHYSQITDDEAYNIVNQFTFNDFILQASIAKSHRCEECTLEKAILSKYTYKQICEMVAERVWAERGESGKIHVQTLVPNIEPFQNRVPMHQIVTEMALVLRQHMSNILGSQLRMNIRALPSWRQKEGAHTEILLYESEGGGGGTKNDTKVITKENSNSTNLKRDTGAEIAVLDSLLKTGTHLDLRAFALDHIPDISLMFTTLVAVDLSYNCLRAVPKELFECTKLEHLYLRHNPISLVSSGMNNLKTLVFLDMSFCELHDSLPDSLFGLTNLRHLDVSYNRLTNISSGISNLKNLRQFVCDGNEITCFPSSIICMENLRLITAKNTWLISQLAQGECSKKPPKLLELLALRLSKYPWKRLLHKMPDSSKTLLFGAHLCDSCSGLRVAQGYRAIVTCQNLFGIKLLPVLFTSCTPECLQKLLSNENDNTNIPSKNAFTVHDQFIAKLKKRHT
ncbi:unnamed protein product [Rotaria magnacalcarata]|uniref:Leucine-rich repeat-containing protein 63 n=3 Tax=Rotaria magnacalcarata TaxID=392030 RepID=A0A816LKG6_9BILA|nr:unnamed protein product [Rotaria magnacalcarata]CAF1993074.1 unnamed protein product [Rotaria magnacalcarata]